ncbi:hypothetical protein BGX33_008224 [Mortierella sp. NVP41]|nr:hypothetical protein BGX33_008224 [Mortierella sp. NVP41]
MKSILTLLLTASVCLMATTVVNASNDDITLCQDINYGGHCVTISQAPGSCIVLSGDLQDFNKEISSAKFPGPEGYSILLFSTVDCTSGEDSDLVVLPGGNHPDFTVLPGAESGNGSDEFANFDNMVASFRILADSS